MRALDIKTSAAKDHRSTTETATTPRTTEPAPTAEASMAAESAAAASGVTSAAGVSATVAPAAATVIAAPWSERRSLLRPTQDRRQRNRHRNRDRSRSNGRGSRRSWLRSRSGRNRSWGRRRRFRSRSGRNRSRSRRHRFRSRSSRNRSWRRRFGSRSRRRSRSWGCGRGGRRLGRDRVVSWLGPDGGRWPHADRQRDQERRGSHHEDRHDGADHQEEGPAAALYRSSADTGMGAGFEISLVDDGGVGVGVLIRNRAVGQSLLTGRTVDRNIEVPRSDGVWVDRTGAGILCIGQGSGRRREQWRNAAFPTVAVAAHVG